MRINLSWWLISIAALSLAACIPEDQNSDFGITIVHESFWGTDYKTPYPFTVVGAISCSIHPEFGSEVYFKPAVYIDESYIGTPLNKAAKESLKQAGLTPNVPYSIKEGADLSDAKEVGMQLCDKQRKYS
jgi:hypothetical protein